MKKHLVSPLRELRKAQRKSVQDLSNRIGIPAYAIHRIERGEQMPDYRQCVKFGLYFGVPWPLIMERCWEHAEKIQKAELMYQKMSESTDESKRVNHLCLSK